MAGKGYTTKAEGVRCADCAAPIKGKVMKCGRCRGPAYCSTKCQKRHWKEGGHKKVCCDPLVKKAAAGPAVAEADPMAAAVKAKIKMINNNLTRDNLKLRRGDIAAMDKQDKEFSPSTDEQYLDPSAIQCLMCEAPNQMIDLTRNKLCPTHGWLCAPCSARIKTCPLCRCNTPTMTEVTTADIKALRARVEAADAADVAERKVERRVDLMVALTTIKHVKGENAELYPGEALDLLEDACKTSGRACLIMGRQLDDLELRRECFKQGAEYNSAVCMYELASLEPEDSPYRRELLRAAANGNCTAAQMTLANDVIKSALVELGRQPDYDIQPAILEELKWISIAAKLGNPHAMVTLAAMFFQTDSDNFLGVYWAAVAHFRCGQAKGFDLLQAWIAKHPQPIMWGDPMERLRRLAMVDGYVEASAEWLTLQP